MRRKSRISSCQCSLCIFGTVWFFCCCRCFCLIVARIKYYSGYSQLAFDSSDKYIGQSAAPTAVTSKQQWKLISLWHLFHPLPLCGCLSLFEAFSMLILSSRYFGSKNESSSEKNQLYQNRIYLCKQFAIFLCFNCMFMSVLGTSSHAVNCK